MKNIEKYTKTKDALEAYAANRNNECRTFEGWLDGEYVEPIAPTLMDAKVGNAAAMREAVVAVVKVGYPHNFQKEAPHIRAYCYEITTAIKKCFAALSSPPRNCDVGTVDEQLNRFSAFCMSRKCNECPFVSSTYGECCVRWSQMPYEEGGEE